MDFGSAFLIVNKLEEKMKRYLLAAAMAFAIATPVMADDVGVRVGPAVPA
jgi:hypothetical protein